VVLVTPCSLYYDKKLDVMFKKVNAVFNTSLKRAAGNFDTNCVSNTGSNSDDETGMEILAQVD